MRDLERSARQTFRAPGDDSLERARRAREYQKQYNDKFQKLLQRHPDFQQQYNDKGETWMRRHYTLADLKILARLRPRPKAVAEEPELTAPPPERKTMAHPTQADFTAEQWDELCLAYLNYKLGFNKGQWWRVLRKHVGYRTGSRAAGELSAAIDVYLLAHGSWVRHQLRKQRPHANCEVCKP